MSQNYKETLNLPKTDFPMKANLAVREPEMLKKWEEAGLYGQIQREREGAELFVLHEDGSRVLCGISDDGDHNHADENLGHSKCGPGALD